MPKAKLVVSTVQFDVRVIADALKLSPEQVTSAFRDGRGAWPFSELRGERLYEFIKHGNTNQPFSNGAVALGQLRDVNVSIKALARGIKFQQSKFVGFNRKTDKNGLIASIEACDRIIVVDITEFPEVRFIPVDATRLVGAAHRDALTINGWSPVAFRRWLDSTYDVGELLLEF